MPQKKNPDSLELLRGKSGRLFGNVSFDQCVYLPHVDIFLLSDGRIPDDVERLALHIQQGFAGRQGTSI
jgi:hypothetical protein